MVSTGRSDFRNCLYIGVGEGYLLRGLGRVLALGAFERMRACGAERAMLVTSSANDPANARYRSLGVIEREQEYAWTWRSYYRNATFSAM